MTNVALIAFGVVGVAFGRCWRYTTEQTLRDELHYWRHKASR